MWNPVEFREAAGRRMIGNMNDISDALIEYHNPGGNQVDKLYILVKECEDWLHKHVGKFFASKQNLKEESAVNILKGQALQELDVVSPGLGTALTNYAGRKTHQGPFGKKFAKLGKGYDKERSTYLAGNKQQSPFSGSQIHARMIHNAPVGEDVPHLSTLSATQWDQIGTATGVRMYFLNKVQRLKHLVTLVATGPNTAEWQNIDGSRHDTQVPAGRNMASDMSQQMYAMDRYGNLFVDYDNAGYGSFVLNAPNNPSLAARNARGMMNHSSFCAGREVICAGMIFFWKGQLIHIDNNSGHYAPNRDALYRAIQCLEENGAPLDLLRVGLTDGQNPMQYFRARTFLTNGAADWPSQDASTNQMPIYTAIPNFVP